MGGGGPACGTGWMGPPPLSLPPPSEAPDDRSPPDFLRAGGTYFRSVWCGGEVVRGASVPSHRGDYMLFVHAPDREASTLARLVIGADRAHSQPATVAPSPPGHTRTTSDTPPNHSVATYHFALQDWSGMPSLPSWGSPVWGMWWGWSRGEMMMDDEFPSGFHSGRAGAPDRFPNPTEWLRMHSRLPLPVAAASDHRACMRVRAALVSDPCHDHPRPEPTAAGGARARA